MKQFARVQRGNAVIPALFDNGTLLDLRPLVSDVTPDTIASHALSLADFTARVGSGVCNRLRPPDYTVS